MNRTKTSRAIAAAMLLASALLAACGGSSAGTNSAPAMTSQTAAPPAETSPSYETLSKGGFVEPAIARITADELKLILDRGQPLIIIDNRGESKFRMGHLPGAINIKYAIDSLFPGDEDTMDRKLAALPDDALKVLYCD